MIRRFIFVSLAGVVIGLMGIYLFNQVGSASQEFPMSSNGSYDEMLIFWTKEIKRLGGGEAYQVFKNKYAHLDINQQHARAHIFGEALYKVEGIEGIVVCDSDHGYGCYHSFFGFALAAEGLDIMSDLDRACIKAHGERGLGCQHGIGHGVLAELGQDRLVEALVECKKLSWQGPIGGCTSGVLMEYNQRTIEQGEIRPLVVGEEYYPCNELPDQFTEACYHEQAAWWSSVYESDYRLIGDLCAKLSDQLDRRACYLGTGNILAGRSEYDKTKIINGCALMPDNQSRLDCTQGAVRLVAAEPGRVDNWRDLCVPLPTDWQVSCLSSHDVY